MASPSVAQAKSILKLIEVLERTPERYRVRVGFLDPDGALHFGTVEFRIGVNSPGWSWEVVNDHVVQLGIEGCANV